MEFKCCRAEVINIENATIIMQEGDHLSVGYIDQHQKFHSVDISARNLYLLVKHNQAETERLVGPFWK